MIKTLYWSLYVLPLLALLAVAIPAFVEWNQAKSDCAHELLRHPLTTTCTP
ncbi:hypothetical protein BJ917_5238 [Pseudomonas sp. WPR_5_2]|nr:hypothetical protein BJ917_5238 [Pseudomonas sp. WPR_5_2]